MKGYIKKEDRKKVLLLCDDIRMHSGIATMAREFVINTSHKYNWFNLGAALKHPEQGKVLDLSEDINKRLDTNISNFEINEYYINHLDDFVLNDYVVKCIYIKAPKKSKLIREIKKNYLIKTEEMVDQMIKLGQNESTTLYYNPEEWIFFDDLLKEIPILENYSKIQFIKRKKKTILEYNDFIYFVNIYDYIIKNGTSPLSFEVNKIKSIILNQRSKDLRKKLRLDLYDDGIKNSYIEKYRL